MKTSESSREPNEICTCFRLRSATRRITQRYERHLRPAGLKITQYSLLAWLIRGGDQSVSALAKALATDRTTLTRNLQPMLTAGYVRVSDGPDARTRSVSVTPNGRKVFDKAAPLWRAAQREMRSALSEEELATLHTLLGRAVKALSL